MAVYVIGDIHGHCDRLERLIERVAPGPEDVVIQLGDCINRGSQSCEVVDYWLGFSRCTRYVLGGNHEELMYDYLVEGSESIVEYGGDKTIESYRRNGHPCAAGDPSSVPASHMEFFLQTLPWTRPFLLTSQYLFTHSGYDFRRGVSEQNPYTLRWGRILGWKPGDPVVVRGHTPHPRVTIRPAVINVDTGCGLGGPLSCLCLQTGKVISEPAEKRGRAR